MKRTPLTRKTPLDSRSQLSRLTSHLTRTPLRARSDRRAAEGPQRADVRRQVLERDKVCQAVDLVPSVACGGPLDVDEIKARSAGGDYLDPGHCQLLCRAHHDYKHAHPMEAHALGLSRFSWE